MEYWDITREPSVHQAITPEKLEQKSQSDGRKNNRSFIYLIRNKTSKFYFVYSGPSGPDVRPFGRTVTPRLGRSWVAVFPLRPYNDVPVNKKLEMIEDYPWTVELS
jgi:hypothetical protein